ncbi:hypothetical protein JI721_15085 [Alicyclobacillus cycloheptanicus]|uniref:Fur-regulated basic protein A n=1 Tax=Alicyclobacillus cycloheptanicus TaxID=1457 RepID=A0ABT9XD90_9BACL|nr:hypothetical protein [Alicyclobacillus cycloheptanicus]MDQ0188264.1 hypothetical protein [Alicyclobacillus cycloheptanicus]WDM00982.1 hypothetical protein JI721_15085 [Alicyclobacillus cycloheptanicus]
MDREWNEILTQFRANHSNMTEEEAFKALVEELEDSYHRERDEHYVGHDDDEVTA